MKDAFSEGEEWKKELEAIACRWPRAMLSCFARHRPVMCLMDLDRSPNDFLGLTTGNAVLNEWTLRT